MISEIINLDYFELYRVHKFDLFGNGNRDPFLQENNNSKGFLKLRIDAELSRPTIYPGRNMQKYKL